MQKIGIIGAGAWGTALAQAIANEERSVLIWAREPEVVESINAQHENTVFLAGVPLKEQITATDSLAAVADCDMILVVTPAQHVRATLATLKSHLMTGTPIVICSKGVELDTGYLMSHVAQEILPNATIAMLTGPTFASEIGRGLPCGVTIAAEEKEVAQRISDALASPTLRPYTTDDIIGAQVGSAVKNVIAIATGIIMGRRMGESARAALLTRGLAEMGRLCTALGGRKETLMGMCGIGDLVLTASSMQSRNYSLGMMLGEGQSLKEILLERNSVTEGVHTAKALMVMAENNAVDMPIAEAVHKCLNEGMSIEDAIEAMVARPLKSET